MSEKLGWSTMTAEEIISKTEVKALLNNGPTELTFDELVSLRENQNVDIVEFYGYADSYNENPKTLMFKVILKGDKYRVNLVYVNIETRGVSKL